MKLADSDHPEVQEDIATEKTTIGVSPSMRFRGVEHHKDDHWRQ